MRPDVVAWWEQARANLTAAKVNQAASIYFSASWFAQQAAEVKARYIERNGALAPKTHNLVFLGGQLSVPPAIETDLTTLNPTFDLVSYPTATGTLPPVRLIDQAPAARDVAAAERVLAWMATRLP